MSSKSKTVLTIFKDVGDVHLVLNPIPHYLLLFLTLFHIFSEMLIKTQPSTSTPHPYPSPSHPSPLTPHSSSLTPYPSLLFSHPLPLTPHPSHSNWKHIAIAIGHFRGLLCLCFKTSLSAKPFIWKWLLHAILFSCKLNMVSHLDSLWNRGTRELGNGPIILYIFYCNN